MRLNEIYAASKDRVTFFVIYTREAHPDDGWRVPENLEAKIHYTEPRTDDERTAVASVCQLKLDLHMPMLIDTIANDAEQKYVSLPMRLYLIGRDGKIAYTGNRGPLGFDPSGWEEATKAELARPG